MARFYSELKPSLIEVGVPTKELAYYKPAFPEDPQQLLNKREKELNDGISKRLGTEGESAAETILALGKEIANLGKKESNDKARTMRIEQIQRRIAAIDTETERLENEIKQIKGSDQGRRNTIRTELVTAYREYFENLKKNRPRSLICTHRLQSKNKHSNFPFVGKSILKHGSCEEKNFLINVGQYRIATWMGLERPLRRNWSRRGLRVIQMR